MAACVGRVRHLNHHTETESADLREACTLLYRCTAIRSATFVAPCVKVDASRQHLDVRPHRPVEGFTPRIAKPAVITSNATLIGQVETGANSSLQAGTVVHVAARDLMTVVGRRHWRAAWPPFVYLRGRNFVARPRPCP